MKSQFDDLTKNEEGFYKFRSIVGRNKENERLLKIYQTLLDETDVKNRRERSFLEHEIAFLFDVLNEPEKSIEFYRKSLENSTNNDRLTTDRNLSDVFRRNNDLRSALEHLNVASKSKMLDENQQMEIDFQRALIFYENKKFDESLKILQHLDEFSRRKTDLSSRFVGAVHHQIGNNFYRMKNYEKAVEFYQKSIQFDERPNPTSFVNLALSFEALDKFETAVEQVQHAWHLSKTIYGENDAETKSIFDYLTKLNSNKTC